MKRTHLEELIKHITRTVLKEYSSMVDSSKSSVGNSSSLEQDSKMPPTDAMSDSEKRKLDRDNRIAAKSKMDAARLKADADKKTIDGYRAQVRNYDQIGKKTNKSAIDQTKKGFRDSGINSSKI